MRNFTFNPFVQNKFATAKTYIAELNNNIESLLEYIELTNPNYSILNKNLGSLVDGAPYYTDKQLLDAGVLKIAISNPNTENAYAFVLICPNKLKLHRGIVQKYGPTCRISLKNDLELASASTLYGNLSSNKKLLVDELIKKFFGEISNEDRNNIKVFNITDTKNIHYIQQGRVIFSQVQQTISDKDSKYKDINNYSVYPVTSPGAFYIPDLIPDRTLRQWTWKLSEQKILDDIVVFFNWFSPNLRFYTKNSLLNYAGYNVIRANTDSRTNNFLSFQIDTDNQINPLITSYSGTMWTGADVNRLLTNYYNTRVLDNIITGEEEILLDDSIDFGKDKLVNYSNPYYNITIEHEHIPENFVRVKLW